MRLNKTPEQWDLVPTMTSRKVDREKGTIEVNLRYEDYDFDSRVVVTACGKAVEIAVWLDKPVPYGDRTRAPLPVIRSISSLALP